MYTLIICLHLGDLSQTKAIKMKESEELRQCSLNAAVEVGPL